MEQDDEFYLVLPSNSSMKYYDNTTTKFTTHLDREIRLQGHWVIGLTDIQIPQTVLHFQKNESIFKFYENILKHFKEGEEKETEYQFKYGLFENIDDLAGAINSSENIMDPKKNILQHQKIIKPDRRGGLWSILRTCECKKPHRTYINSKVTQILGFQQNTGILHDYLETSQSKKLIQAIHPPCLSRALPNQLFIYSDICTPYHVGDTRASLLRIASLNTSNYIFGNTIIQSFAPVQYLPVLKNSFQDLSIDIRDQYGEPISFLFGTLTVTLHFKRER